MGVSSPSGSRMFRASPQKTPTKYSSATPASHLQWIQLAVVLVLLLNGLRGTRSESPSKPSPAERPKAVETSRAQVAFQSNRSDRHPPEVGTVIMINPRILDVYLLNLKGGEPLRLSYDKQEAFLFYRTRQRWSPDGKWLGWPGEFDMFISGASTNTRTIRLVEDSARCNPLLGPPPPGPLPRIMREWPTLALTILAWAPDSQRLVVWNSHSWKTMIYRLDGNVEKEIKPMPSSSLADLDWSSKGLMAEVFSGSTGECSIFLLAPPFEQASRKRILDFGGTIAGLRFSPQGDALTFVGKKADKWAVYVLDLATEHLAMVAGGVDGDTSPKWFHNMLPPDRPEKHLWVLEGCRARWSPDGKRLAFGSDGQIKVVNRDGGGLKDVTPQGIFADGPSWTPDGRRILFHGTIQPNTTSMNSGFSVYIIDADGKNVERLTEGPTQGASDFYPEWQPTVR